MWAPRRRTSASAFALALALLSACSELPGSCPRGRPFTLARATDESHVELVFACRVDRGSAEDSSSFTIGDYTTAPVRSLAVLGASRTDDDRVVLSTAAQTALVTYTLGLSGVRDDDGNRLDGSVNFVGVGQADAARVTFQVDDRYNTNLKQVELLASIDPLTGVFSQFAGRIPLSDPDGDHIFEAVLSIAADPSRTADTGDDRLGPQYVAYTVRAVDDANRPLSQLVAFEVPDNSPQTVKVPLLSVPPPPPPEGLVTVAFKVDDRPAVALSKPSLRASFDSGGVFDASFPSSIALADPDGDNVWEGTAKVRIDPARTLDGSKATTQPYSVYLVDGTTPYSARSADFVVPDEKAVSATILVGNKDMVPVTFRVDASAAWLDTDGNNKGVYQGEAVFLTGEFGVAEDAFGQNATDSFAGGENVVLQMVERLDHVGVWERTIFLPPGRPYGWKVLRCPRDKGCTQLNKMVTSSGRAFPTVMKNLVTELCDASKKTWSDPNCNSPRIIDPRTLNKVDTGAGVMDYSSAKIFIGTGAGLQDQKDPANTPNPTLMFKQEVPDLVVDVKTTALRTPVQVIGSWRDVNIPGTPADIITGGTVVDLTRTDYDSGLIGLAPPSYNLPPPTKPSPFKMDGVLDGTSTLIEGGSGGRMPLHLALSGNHLYLATDDAGEGSDNFLFVSTTPAGALRSAPWAKAGKVALGGKTLFIADENDSNFAGWFQLGTPQDTLLESMGGNQDPALDVFAPAQNGGVIEGSIDLAAVFGGTLPTVIYVATAPYASPDGGTLYSAAQSPTTKNGDENIDATEILKISLPQLKVVP